MIPCTVGIHGAVQNGLTVEDAFCMGKPHSEHECEGALAGAKIRFMLVAAIADWLPLLA